LPLRATEDGVRVAVRISPHARADRINGFAGSADGGTELKVAVSAPAAAGLANEALLQLLAKEWRIPRRELTLVSGRKSRDKIVQIAGDPTSLMDRLRAALTAAHKAEEGEPCGGAKSAS
jgi:uncharacterized protein